MGRVKHRTSWAISTSFAVAFGSLAVVRTSSAAPAVPLAAKKKPKKAKSKPGLSPDDAETKRQAIRDAVQSDREDGNLDAVARGLEDNGALLGDPVVLLEAGETRLELAEQEGDIAEAERAIETTLVALDMLYFYDAVSSGQAHSDWLVIEPRRASSLISDAKRQIEQAEALIERIERGRLGDDEADPGPIAAKPEKKQRDRKPMRPGTGLIIAGAGFTVIGVAGASLGIAGMAISSAKQNEVEGKMIPEEQDEVERLDAEGRRANIMGYTGIGLAAGALAIGVPLLVVGIMKRKKSGDAPASARVRLSPMVAGHQNGFVLSGSF